MEKRRYEPQKIEEKWLAEWKKSPAVNHAEDFSEKKKRYILVEFPYPSGDGLHVGHVWGYTMGDVLARFYRLNGENVLFPMGWDAFGLPTENYAIKTGISPQDATKANVEMFRHQMDKMGFSFDWEREANTTDPSYYRFTQWIFIQLFKKGLAYKKSMPINWCPKCKTGLANEEVTSEGLHERCGTAVEEKMLDQWVLKITAYADRLIDDLATVDFSPEIKAQQINWIGRSKGAYIDFAVDGNTEKIKVFTTRADTLPGATYLVIAPEHPLVESLTSKDQAFTVSDYVAKAKRKTTMQREETQKEKSGVFTGSYAVNPFTKEQIPVWIADYVLMDYGTGAIMSVPGHDERDFEFASKYKIPMREVVRSNQGYIGYVKPEWSGNFDAFVKGLQAMGANISWPKKDAVLYTFGVDKVDQFIELAKASAVFGTWHDAVGPDLIVVFSGGEVHRIGKFVEDEKVWQRMCAEEEGVREYSGIWSMLYANTDYREHVCFTGEGVAINAGVLNDLPTSKVKENAYAWLMEQAIGQEQTTYRLRDWIFSRQRYWGEPVPMVSCAKCGWQPIPESELPLVLPVVSNLEPFEGTKSPLARLEEWVNTTCPVCGGPAVRETDTMPNWAGSSWYFLRYVDPQNNQEFASKKKLDYFMPVDLYIGGAEHTTLHLLYSRFWHKFLFDLGLVATPEPYAKRRNRGIILAPDGRKMSKSFGNVINPLAEVEKIGADALRLYELFMGPYNETFPWNPRAEKGVYRFLERVYLLGQRVVEERVAETDPAVVVKLHQTIKRVTEDLPELKFNTAIAAMMEFINLAEDKPVSPADWRAFVVLLSVSAPFVSEELWQMLGEDGSSITQVDWPRFNPVYLIESEVTIPIQINGKLRATITVPTEQANNEEYVFELAKADQVVAKLLAEGGIVREIYVPMKMISFVVNRIPQSHEPPGP